MNLTPKQRRALESICDTFAPGAGGLPSASQLGVPDALLALVARNPHESERQQFLQLLSLWDSRLNSLWSGGLLRRFSGAKQETREKILLSWCDSRLEFERAAFQVLKRASLLLYYMLPGANGAANPAWKTFDYPGPLGPPKNPPAKKISPMRIEQDTNLVCDVCVIGSGAGGGTAAGVLASAGLDVIVLEAGGYYDDADFDGGEMSGLSRLYWQGGGATTQDQGIILLAGECLGGGTVVNYCTSFRTPDAIRAQWAATGVPQFSQPEFTRSLDAVCERLGVSQAYNAPARREQLMRRGLEKRGWHVDAMPRNVRGCDEGHACGYCGYGCTLGAKQSTTKTWLADAAARGARFLVHTRAEKIVIERGEARGVEAVNTQHNCRVNIRARTVISACGSIHTPALLLRSGLRNRNIGQHLHLHPVTSIWGEFNEDVRPWEGTLQAFYSDQFATMNDGFGFKFETTAEHPSLCAVFLPWRSATQSADLTARLKKMFGLGILLRDRDSGSVTISRDGHPITRYSLSAFDTNHLRVGIRTAAQVMEAAGAVRINTSQSKWVSYEPGKKTLDDMCHAADACGFGPGQLALASFHIMGTARMGGSKRHSVCNPDGQTWETRNLYVCDASTFPSASGVNPMITIEAVAHMTASRLASKM